MAMLPQIRYIRYIAALAHSRTRAMPFYEQWDVESGVMWDRTTVQDVAYVGERLPDGQYQLACHATSGESAMEATRRNVMEMVDMSALAEMLEADADEAARAAAAEAAAAHTAAATATTARAAAMVMVTEAGSAAESGGTASATPSAVLSTSTASEAAGMTTGTGKGGRSDEDDGRDDDDGGADPVSEKRKKKRSPSKSSKGAKHAEGGASRKRARTRGEQG